MYPKDEKKVDIFFYELHPVFVLQMILFIPMHQTLVMSPCSWKVQMNVIQNRIPSESYSIALGGVQHIKHRENNSVGSKCRSEQ